MFGFTKTPSRRIFGKSSVEFLRGPPRPVSFRLDVREDRNDRGMFLSDSSRSTYGGPSARLANYISAGGMRDLQPSRHADLDASHRLFVIRLGLGLLVFWLLFFFLPCR